jgi:hypothetical protein
MLRCVKAADWVKAGTVKKEWLWLSAFAVLLLACALVGWFQSPQVSVRIRDHRLSVYQARMWYCDPGAPPRLESATDYPLLRWLDKWRCRLLRQTSSAPVMGWLSNDPRATVPQDALLLFGYYTDRIGNGFDLIRTNGDRCSWGPLCYGNTHRRGMVCTNFVALFLVQTNFHGVFRIRLTSESSRLRRGDGETNVLAEIRIR